MKDRILQIIKAEELTAAKFAQEIGVQPSSISHIVSGRNKASVDLITKILRRFPGISTDWLILGKGEMYKSDINTNLPEPGKASGSAPDLFNQPPNQHDRQETQQIRDYDNIKLPQAGQQVFRQDKHPEPASGTKQKGKSVEKILVFYSDKTFSAYFPE